MKRFSSRSFKECVYVQIKVEDQKDFGIVRAILQFCIDNNLWNFGPSTTGVGVYYALHTKENADKIKKFVSKWIKENP